MSRSNQHRQCLISLAKTPEAIRPGGLFELPHGSLDVLTPRTFKGTEIETRRVRLNARQINRCDACWALWPCINWRGFKCVEQCKTAHFPNMLQERFQIKIYSR